MLHGRWILEEKTLAECRMDFLLDMFPQSPMNSSERTSKTSKSKINLNTEMHVNNAAILNVFQGWKVIPKPPRVKEEWM